VAACLAIPVRIGPGALGVTTGATIDFPGDFPGKPAPHSDLRAGARVLKPGRVLAVADRRICSAGMAGPVARASLTCSVPPPRQGVMVSAWRA